MFYSTAEQTIAYIKDVNVENITILAQDKMDFEYNSRSLITHYHLHIQE